MAEAEVLVNWQRQRLAEAEVEKPHPLTVRPSSVRIPGGREFTLVRYGGKWGEVGGSVEWEYTLIPDREIGYSSWYRA